MLQLYAIKLLEIISQFTYSHLPARVTNANEIHNVTERGLNSENARYYSVQELLS